MIWNVLLETLIDVLKALPILFIVYLLVEFFSHKKHEHTLTKTLNKFGPLMSGLIGCVPQCGFNAALADLYSRRKITIGTLFAVFIATSDEAVAIFLAHPEFYGHLILLISIKFVVAIFFGYMLDFIVNKNRRNLKIIDNESLNSKFVDDTNMKIIEDESMNSQLAINETNISKKSCDLTTEISNNKSVENIDLEIKDKDCNLDKLQSKCKTCGGHSSNSILLNALIHATKIALLLFVVASILNVLIEFIGEENIKQLLNGGEIFTILIAALIGLIPACGISVIFASLFISGMISFATVISALCAGTGLGLAVLLAKNKNIKENIFIIILLYCVSVLVGMLVYLANLLFF